VDYKFRVMTAQPMTLRDDELHSTIASRSVIHKVVISEAVITTCYVLFPGR
jgi:hypothetical protein